MNDYATTVKNTLFKLVDEMSEVSYLFAQNPEIAFTRNRKLNFETLIKFGSPAQSIISLAKDEKFNLIVVGSRGLSGLSEFLLGSVSNKISHAATIPVLIVK